MNKIIIKIKLILTVLLFNSCSDKFNDKDNLVFRYNEHKNISSLDPAFAKDNADIWVINQLFNGLVEMDKDLNIIPSIAKSWTISEDGKTYSFNLKTDIKFHKHVLLNDRKVIANDFTYSFDRILDKRLASPGAWVLDKVKDYEAVNDSVFKIELNEPFNAFLGILSMKYCSVVPKEIVEHYGNDFRKNPIGTGPFKFKRWEENIKLVLRKNYLYFEKDRKGKNLPYLEAISITFLPDKKSEFMEFAQNKIDFINSIDSSFKDQLISINGNLKKEHSKKIKLISGPYLNTEYIGFYLGDKKSQIRSKKLRLAINYAIDRKKMMKYLRNNIGYPANNGFVPLGLNMENSVNGFNYNLKKAKTLIQEYKVENNKEKIELILTSDANYLDIVEFIQRELQKIDIDLSINIVPASTLRQGKSNGKFEMFRASWIADYPDSENYLSLFYSKNLAPNGPNYTHFKSIEFDRLFESTYQEQNSLIRKNIYKELDSLVLENSPIIPLYYDKVMRFSQKNIEGLTTNPVNQLNLKKVYKK